jgi:hypothetical protein
VKDCCGVVEMLAWKVRVGMKAGGLRRKWNYRHDEYTLDMMYDYIMAWR